MSLTVVEQGEIISLRESWSISKVASGKSVRSGCAYGWVKTCTPFNSCFTFSNSDKYLHILCNTLDAMIEYLCLWLSIAVFE
jgi:hypothetical protein